jgi:phenylalanyl-tRNA synthetase beta chain
MKVSLNWLTDYVDVAMPAAELAELLTAIGLSCEGVIASESDIVLDIDVTANRPDCLGHLGVAREIAAATGAEFRMPDIGELPASGKAGELTAVEVLAPEMCPRYTARIIRGVKIGPSPRWMVERLEAVGMRSVSNVVDVTNFVLMEFSQPLHSFDLDKLDGRRIVVRPARPGEVMVSIDGTTCRLDERMLVIADASRPVAVAGVMGGLDTEVSDGTVNLLIESAQFDPLTTRYTSRTLQLMSESNLRFERGIDPVLLDAASLRACQLIVATAGGELAEGVVDVWAAPWRAKRVTLRPARCEAVLGVGTPPARQVEILAGLGLRPTVKDGAIVCTIPSHRADLTREIDLVEEIARMGGYGRIPVSADVCHPVRGESREHRTKRLAGRAMTACGFDEAVCSTFVDAAQAEHFGAASPVGVDARVRKTNNKLRTTVLPSLLTACKTNQDAGNADASLFEIATVFAPVEGRSRPAEHVELGAVTVRDLRDLRGAVEALAGDLCPGATVSVEAADAPGFATGQAGALSIDGRSAGAIGVISPAVMDYYGLHAERPVAAATVRFDVLEELAGRARVYRPLAKFPPVRRDLSVVIAEDVTWGQLAAAIGETDQPQRVSAAYVTTYRGKQIPAGLKSVTFELTYRSAAETLRGEQVDALVAEVLSKMKARFSAELRA